jgi:predicted ArsR family transcriptional regulator
VTAATALPGPLARLVGNRRARILETLTSPSTTAEVANTAEIAANTAPEHLHELVRARVVNSCRSGRCVLHVLTDLGERLVREIGATARTIDCNARLQNA